jgi:hypothetical protein
MKRSNGKLFKSSLTSCLALAILSMTGAQADIVSVTGPNSSAGQPPQIVPNPPDLTNQCVTNAGMQGFNEKQQVTTSTAYSVDGGTIPSGTTLVNSHMIFMNQTNGVTSTLSHTGVTWTFDFPIIGVMSDVGGNFEAASTPAFGAVGTNYTSFPTSCGTSEATDKAAPYPERGIESGDSYTVSGNTITLNLGVTQPGDWVRVLTRGQGVGIDIKPGGYPNCFNINGNGVVPVAILGSSSFHVSDINTSTLSFNGLTVRVKGNNQNQCSTQDVNGDGFPDLVCQFQDNTANWIQGSSIGVVTGQLRDNTGFRGTDSICVVP